MLNIFLNVMFMQVTSSLDKIIFFTVLRFSNLRMRCVPYFDFGYLRCHFYFDTKKNYIKEKYK